MGELVKTGGPGRPKGSQNRFTSLKEAFVEAFEQIGGLDGLVEWAKKEKNRGLYYRILASLFPKQVAVSARMEQMNSLSKLSEEELMAIIRKGEKLAAEVIETTFTESQETKAISVYQNGINKEGSSK